MGLGVFTAFSALMYWGAVLAPGKTDPELDRLTDELGGRVGERHRQMELERRYSVAISRVAFPASLVLFVLALILNVVR